MIIGPTVILYLTIGSGVTVALYLSQPPRRGPEQWFQLASAIVFWPLYLPILLNRSDTEERPAAKPASAPPDELSTAIAQVETELETAIHSLDGWAEGVLNREHARLLELQVAWKNQAERIREMDALLHSSTETAWTVPASAGAEPERWRQSADARRQNMNRLKQVRERTYQDLMITLSWVRELVSMIHLAKFTGAPASRAEELVAQIAASVEGLSALTWQEEPLVAAGEST